MASANFTSSDARSVAAASLHSPASNAARAAAIARRASSRPPRVTRAKTSHVAGLTISLVFPEAASTHSPLMNILCVSMLLVLPYPHVLFLQDARIDSNDTIFIGKNGIEIHLLQPAIAEWHLRNPHQKLRQRIIIHRLFTAYAF